MTPTDRAVCLALQGLVLVTPLLLGGRHPWTVPLATPVILTLLAVTIRERRRRGASDRLPAVAALAGFVALALLTTLPLSPGTLARLAPATARLYAEALPGWPSVAEWSQWRSLALDPWAVLVEIGRLSIGLSVFAVVVAYPWRNDALDEAPVTRVLGRLLLTLIGGGAMLAALAVAEDVAGNGFVLWVTDVTSQRGRASGPFVNPNHLAVWLEMVVPLALAFAFALASRLRRRIRGAAHTGRGMGVRAPRAWMAALIANQRRVGPPLLAMSAAVLMIAAHLATGSRGGTAALLVGLAVTAAGITVRTRPRDGQSPFPRWLPAALALVLVVASVGAIGLWATSESDDLGASTVENVDVSFASRLAVSAQGRGVVRDHPIFGTGLGSWLHAFRPYQAPPVEGGIWDHAHNDYLELAAETGLAGVALVLLFVVAVAHASRRERSPDARERRRGYRRPAGLEVPEWRAALGERTLLRCGLVGGVAAVLVHGVVEFGLRMPANLLTLMVLLALLMLSARRDTAAEPDAVTGDGVEPLLLTDECPPQRAAWSPALACLFVLLAATSLPRLANGVLVLAGATPLAPRDCLDAADRLSADADESTTPVAVALIRRAIDRSPADIEGHLALASIRGPGPEGEAALGRAITLAPWSVAVRDTLALRQLARGERDAGVRELEEAMARFPYLVSHAYLSPDSDTAPRDPSQLIRMLADGDTMVVRLQGLDDDMAGAIERGLVRALDGENADTFRAGIVHDLVTLLEVRGKWADAAERLRAEAQRGTDSRVYLARAATDYLKAQDHPAAERALLAALAGTPESGNLYRKLAVEVYAARGDFDTAATVLKAGERNALDMLPVYRGVTELITRREAAEDDHAARAWAGDGEAEEAP